MVRAIPLIGGQTEGAKKGNHFRETTETCQGAMGKPLTGSRACKIQSSMAAVSLVQANGPANDRQGPTSRRGVWRTQPIQRLFGLPKGQTPPIRKPIFFNSLIPAGLAAGAGPPAGEFLKQSSRHR